jgi:tetratricopeptide (TPR) repeat protein
MVFAAGAWALQQQPAKGQGQQQQPAPAPGVQPGQTTPPAQPAVNPEEENAYKAFFDLKAAGDEKAMVASGEEFLKKFPQSRYRESVYSRLTQGYLNMGQLDKMLVAGEKALEINPDDVDVLSVLSFGMLRRFNREDLDAEQKLEKTERYAKHAIGLLNAMTKPETMIEENFVRAKNEKLSMCNSGLGLSYLHRQRYADSITAFEQATTLAPSPDPTDQYLLGVLYEATKRYADAAATFGKCGESVWAWQDRCKSGAEKNKKLAAIQGTPPKQ